MRTTHNKLMELADFGYFIGGKGARLMFDGGFITFWITTIIYLIHYQMSDNQWILKISEFYERIKTPSMERKLRAYSTLLIKLSKFVTLLTIFLGYD